MKKGFTIVEIILSISLVIIIGVVSLFSFNLIKKQNLVKNLNSMKTTIYQAMNVYIETHNETKEQLFNKKNGVAIPLVTLEKEGLIDFGNLDIEDQFVVTALAEENDCSDPSELPSWDFGENRVLYICSDADQAIKTLEGRINQLETEMLSLTMLSNNLSSKIDTESTAIQTKIDALKNDLTTINTNIQKLSNGGIDTSTNIGKARNEAYYYKGSRADNYIKMNSGTYRIIMIDTDNSIVVADRRNSNISSSCRKSTTSSADFLHDITDLIPVGDNSTSIYASSWIYNDYAYRYYFVSATRDLEDYIQSSYEYAYRLKSSIKINGGTGTSDNPYTISSTC